MPSERILRQTRIIPAAGKPWSGWPASSMDYWRLLAKMLNEEPVHERDRMMVAMLKPLGIEKVKPFQPDARQQKILAQAAIVGEAMARSLSYAKRQPEAHIWSGTHWKNAVLLEANQETEHHTALDERHGMVLRSRDPDCRNDDQNPWYGTTVHRHPERQRGQLASGRQHLQFAHSASCARQTVLVDHALRH